MNEQSDRQATRVRGGQAWLARLEPIDDTATGERERSFRALALAVSSRWLRVLGCGLAGLLVGIAIAFLWPPSYRAATLVAHVSDADDPASALLMGNRLGSLADLVGLNVNSDASGKEEALAQLRSRAFTLAFIGDEGLMPILFSRKWDSERQVWRGEPPTEEDAYQLFDRAVRSVDEDRRTGLVTVAVEWKDRKLAAGWANRLVERANAASRGRVMKETATSLRFLEGELNKTQTIEIRQAIFALIESQKKKQMVANVRPEYSFRVIDPARVPDADRFNHPKRALLILAGFFGGLFAGLLAAVVPDLRAELPPSSRRASA